MTKESISELLGKKTLKEIANAHDKSVSSVKRMMRKHGLKQDKDFIRENRLKSSSLGGKALTGKKKERMKIDGMEVKWCPKCKNDVPLENYYMYNSRINSYCKSCTHQYSTEAYIGKKIWAIEHKGGKCQDCSEEFHYAVFEFHHREPDEKDMDWNTMRKLSKDKIKKELDKCDMLCANCHRMRHVVTRGNVIG